jgi:hypothetical protein
MTAPASAAAPVVPLGANAMQPSTTGGPTLPATGLSANHCGTQVPDGAIVRSDGSIVDAQGHPVTGNVVCSYSDVANNATTNGTTTNAFVAGSGVQPQTIITQITDNMTEIAYQRAPLNNQTTGWKSITMSIKVPMEPHGDLPLPWTIRYFSGFIGDDDNSTIIAGALQYLNGQFSAVAMMENKINQKVYSDQVAATNGDTIVVSVQQSPITSGVWIATVTNSRTGLSHSLNVQFSQPMNWALPAVSDAHDASGNPLSSDPNNACGYIPHGFTSVHFGSPSLVLPGQPAFTQPFSPAYSPTLTVNCSWGAWVQTDNGNQSGYLNFIWDCNPVTCGGGTDTCGLAPVQCTDDAFTNCGTCPSGLMCKTAGVGQNTCVAACNPLTCDGTCGSKSDGCGGTLNCGGCAGTQGVCVAGTCQCTPLTCQQMGLSCGAVDNGCGTRITCGPTCAPPKNAPAIPRGGAALLSLLLGGLGFTLVTRSKRSRSSEVS